MNIVFFADKTAFSSSLDFLTLVFRQKFNIFQFEIERNENGKPFLRLPMSSSALQIFFSISHTNEKYFLAISHNNVGIDAEPLSRSLNYTAILPKFSQSERNEIKTCEDFLKFWTIKESAIKWLGGSIARDLRKISYENNLLKYDELELPITLTQTICESHIISICYEENSPWQFEKVLP